MRYKIGDFLKRVRVPVQIEDDVDYQLVTIKVNHRGVVPRGVKKGIEIGSKTMYRVTEGQFILSGIDARNGAFGIIPKELEGAVVTNDFWYFDYEETIVCKEYFLLLTSTPLFANICRIASEGTTNRVRLQAKVFFDYEVDLPEVSEQKRIVTEFSKTEIDYTKLQTELKTQATLLTQLRQAYLQEAVMGQLTASTTDDAHALLADIKAQKAQLIKEGKLRKEKPLPPIKPEEIPFEIPKNWVWCRLGEVCEINMGQSPEGTSYNEQGIGVPLINGPVEFGGMGAFDKTVKRKFTTEPTKMCKEGDLLICVRGSTTGRTNISSFDACIGRGVASIRPFLFDKFIFYFIIFARNSIFNLGRGSTFPNISQEQILNICTPLPPLFEQQAIVAKVEGLLEKVSALEAENKAQQAELERLMSAVLQESFSNTVAQTA